MFQPLVKLCATTFQNLVNLGATTFQRLEKISLAIWQEHLFQIQMFSGDLKIFTAKICAKIMPLKF